MKLEVKILNENAKLPTRAHPDDAGLDLYSVEEVELAPGDSKSIKTGIAVVLPPKTNGELRPKSGLARKYQITLLNSPGTIDVGYHGEVEVILINHGKKAFQVSIGNPIAQMVISPICTPDVKIEEVQELPGSERGKKGFGSSYLVG